MYYFAPENCHDPILRNHKPELAFDPNMELEDWRNAAGPKLRELIGRCPDKVPLNIRIEYQQEQESFFETRFVFTSEAFADVPCHLLIPKGRKGPFPVIICLQGHSTGMHISLGRPQYDGDIESIQGGRDFALQVIRQGYAALVIEQRCLGERKDKRPDVIRHFSWCSHASMNALLLGRTMIGERVWDVSRAIDALYEFPDIDTTRIGCMGNSGGGTIAYYAACLDDRIKIAMPSCSVCTYQHSIANVDHCHCNYIPGIARYFDMGDIAGLIAPRPLIVVAGRSDDIFPIEGVEKAYRVVKEIYTKADVPDLCRLVIGEGGHRFYPEEAWPVFNELAGWRDIQRDEPAKNG